jgi:predicted dehydrogenase
MFDMGPYYLTALISLLGPIDSVVGSTRITTPKRTITSQPHYGREIEVEVPTHVAGLINFQSGAVGTIITSFDVWAAELPRIEIYGTRGSLSVPDPNTFGGPVRIFRAGGPGWEDVPIPFGYVENSRGLGVADMAVALRTGRKPRNDGTQTYHVLDAMHAFHDASDTGIVVKLASSCARPAPLPLGLRDGQMV